MSKKLKRYRGALNFQAEFSCLFMPLPVIWTVLSLNKNSTTHSYTVGNSFQFCTVTWQRRHSLRFTAIWLVREGNFLPISCMLTSSQFHWSMRIIDTRVFVFIAQTLQDTASELYLFFGGGGLTLGDTGGLLPGDEAELTGDRGLAGCSFTILASPKSATTAVMSCWKREKRMFSSSRPPTFIFTSGDAMTCTSRNKHQKIPNHQEE